MPTSRDLLACAAEVELGAVAQASHDAGVACIYRHADDLVSCRLRCGGQWVYMVGRSTYGGIFNS